MRAERSSGDATCRMLNPDPTPALRRQPKDHRTLSDGSQTAVVNPARTFSRSARARETSPLSSMQGSHSALRDHRSGAEIPIKAAEKCSRKSSKEFGCGVPGRPARSSFKSRGNVGNVFIPHLVSTGHHALSLGFDETRRSPRDYKTLLGRQFQARNDNPLLLRNAALCYPLHLL
jgi:hypothetical protein